MDFELSKHQIGVIETIWTLLDKRLRVALVSWYNFSYSNREQLQKIDWQLKYKKIFLIISILKKQKFQKMWDWLFTPDNFAIIKTAYTHHLNFPLSILVPRFLRARYLVSSSVYKELKELEHEENLKKIREQTIQNSMSNEAQLIFQTISNLIESNKFVFGEKYGRYFCNQLFLEKIPPPRSLTFCYKQKLAELQV